MEALSVGAWPRLGVLGLVKGVGRAGGLLLLLVNGLVGVTVPHDTWEAKVDIVVSSPLAVHLVDKEAGDGLEEQAEDGHAGTEAERVPGPLHQALRQRVVDAEVDDVSQRGHRHADQKHKHCINGVPLSNGPHAHG